MDHQLRHRAVRQTMLLTGACIVGSVLITCIVTYLMTGVFAAGVGLMIAVLAPAILAPMGSYFHISMALKLRDANDRLRRLSETDPLTDTFNRRRFLEVAEGQIELARRHCYPTSVLLIDFDHFKRVNDEFGHLAGDRVLVESCELIRGMLRTTDTLARFGGEEFICLLPHTAREGALMVAERVLQAVRHNIVQHDDRKIQVTVSIGGVTSESSEISLERMTSRADILLYEAKQAGRDRYMIETLPRPGTLLQQAGVS